MRDEQTRRPRPRAFLACDTCRRRKSRCDGLRPTCSHCQESGSICHYRTLPTSFGSDSSVLSRLENAEARIQLLEDQANARAPVVRNNIVDDVVDAAPALPEFHHGANHKILQYWSRLRVQLTLPDIDVFSYIKNAEASDLHSGSSAEAQRSESVVSLGCVKEALETLDYELHNLPITMGTALSTFYCFNNDRLPIKYVLSEPSGHENGDLKISTLSANELILCGIAFKVLQLRRPVSNEPGVAEICFSTVLTRLWIILLSTDEETVQLLFTLACLHLDLFREPFHALALLKIIEPIMEELMRNTDNLENESASFVELYYMLQSDILSELDGIPMRRTPCLKLYRSQQGGRTPRSAISNSSHPKELTLFVEREGNVNRSNDDGSCVGGENHTAKYYLSLNLWLRARLNQIISDMYTTDQAYCRPHNVASTIINTSSKLESWYRSLPVNLQFVRDVKSFEMLRPKMPIRLKEISLRYYSGLLALNRPVLYWVLYEDIEDPTPSSTEATCAEQRLEPWIFSSCRDCMESAKLIIATLALCIQRDGMGLTWCDTQLLLGSYAVLLSVQSAPSFSSEFRDVLGISKLLDTAEELFSIVAPLSLADQKTLDILLNVRRNFEASSPLATMT